MILGRFVRSRRGSVMTEFALIFPIAIAMVWAIIETSWQVWIKSALDSALADATRCTTIGYKDLTVSPPVDCTVLMGNPSSATFMQTKAVGVPFPDATTLTVSENPSKNCLAYSYQSTWLTPLTAVTPPVLTGWMCYNY
jgi:Flp pilus assembly protein TadG